VGELRAPDRVGVPQHDASSSSAIWAHTTREIDVRAVPSPRNRPEVDLAAR